jgi:hypothetical protein
MPVHQETIVSGDIHLFAEVLELGCRLFDLIVVHGSSECLAMNLGRLVAIGFCRAQEQRDGVAPQLDARIVQHARQQSFFRSRISAREQFIRQPSPARVVLGLLDEGFELVCGQFAAGSSLAIRDGLNRAANPVRRQRVRPIQRGQQPRQVGRFGLR